MKRFILGSTALVGVATLAAAAQASDGIKLDVGGFFQTVYGGVFDKKAKGHFGDHHNTDRFLHNAEVHFKGETTLDNGLTVGAHIELEGENAGDQIDKSWVYWSGGFGKVQIGSQDKTIGAYCLLPPGATANFSAFSPASWGSNDPIGSNSACADTEGNSQGIVYITPNFSGFQLRVAYTPSGNAEDYTQNGVNGHGTPTTPNGTFHHAAGLYATYDFAGDGWGVDWGGGISHQFAFNHTVAGNNGRSTDYQSGLNVNFGGFGVGVVSEYFANGGGDNDAWIIGGGLSYGVDAWTVGLQGSHGHYNASTANGANGGGHDSLNRIIATGSYAMGPGVTLDAELGYTWFHDTGGAADPDQDSYHAFDVQVGSALTF
jgi:outer membrane protein OmpU